MDALSLCSKASDQLNSATINLNEIALS